MIESFLGTQLLQKSSKWEKEILLFLIIITGLIQNFIKVFVPFVGFHVHFQPMLLNLRNIGYQILIHNLNQGMPMLKIDNITKYLNITKIGSLCSS